MKRAFVVRFHCMGDVLMFSLLDCINYMLLKSGSEKGGPAHARYKQIENRLGLCNIST